MAHLLILYQLLAVAVVHFVSFGIMCAMISTRTAPAALRRAFDVIMAIVTLPVAVEFYKRLGPSLDSPPIFPICTVGAASVAFAAAYAYLRRLALR